VLPKIAQDLKRKNSTITSDDFYEASKETWIEPEILAAFARNDSQYWTAWTWSTNYNPWNIGQFDRLTTAVKGYNSWKEWLNAIGENLNKRTFAFKMIYDREPTVKELATWISREWKRFYWPYMTDPGGASRVEQIYNQLKK
jgi:hypothetical protein